MLAPDMIPLNNATLTPVQRTTSRYRSNPHRHDRSGRSSPAIIDPESDPFSLASTMSIVRLFVKNNPEGCPVFEISSTKREVIEILFPSPPKGVKSEVVVGTVEGMIPGMGSLMTPESPKDFKAVVTGPSPVRKANERKIGVIGLGIDMGGPLAGREPAETSIPIDVILPSTSPAPTTSTGPPPTRPQPLHPCPYLTRPLPSPPSVDLSTTLNAHALSSSQTEDKFLILPNQPGRLRLSLARLGAANWEERRRRVMGEQGGFGGQGRSGAGMGGGEDGHGRYLAVQGARRIVSAKETYGTSGKHRVRTMQNEGPFPIPNYPSQVFPATPPYLHQTSPQIRSSSQTFQNSPLNHITPRSSSRHIPSSIPPFIWPDDLSPLDRTVLIRPHEILDHILSFGYRLLGSHVEAYGWEGGICDVHTFAGPGVGVLREKLEEVRLAWRSEAGGVEVGSHPSL